MARTIIRIGSYAAFVVETKDVSPLLGIFERATPVDRRWMDDGARWVLADEHAVEIVQDRSPLPLLTKEQCDAIRESERVAREAKAAEEEASAEG